jgi:hypothetical protein
MISSYYAKLLGDRIKWIGKKPKNYKQDETYKIEIKIIESKNNTKTNSNFVELMRQSPLLGVDLDLNRSEDTGRNIEL